MKTMQTILVTGGAGFVGSYLALGLRSHRDDARVVALDNLKRRGAELNLPRLHVGGVEFVHGDIRNPEDLAAVGAVDVVLECSAEPSVLAGYESSPEYLVNTNLTGTINCLELARRHGAAVIFLSTSRVYPMAPIAGLNYEEKETRFELTAKQNLVGASEHGLSEEFPLEGVRSLYGATKLCSELILREYLDMYKLRGVINRCGVLTGPWQMGKVDQGVAVLWMARHIFGGKLNYIGYGGHGKQVRDILHIDDLFQLVLHQMEHLEEFSGETFNVGGGRAVSLSLQEMTALCQEISGKTIEIGSIPEDRAADIPLYLTDHRKVTQATGWKPQRDPKSIFEDIHAWIKEHEAQLRPILGE
jgi:CDP-paratose 2-epimerase